MGITDLNLRYFHAGYRVMRSFDLRPNGPLQTVGQLIDYVASSTALPAETIIKIRRFPSSEDLRCEAFRQLQEALRVAGGQVPETVDADLEPNDLLPSQHRSEKWAALSEHLNCELPLLQPTGWRFGAVFWVVYALMLAIWVGLTYKFGFDDDPTTLLGWIAAGVFTLVMYCGSLIVAAAAAEAASPRHLMPFASIAEMSDYIQRSARTRIEDALIREVDSTIHDYVVDVVSEEFDVPRDAIGLDFDFTSSGSDGKVAT